ncbi:MAG: hypothetical protein ACK57N_11975 [Planctomycetia bacterium]
MKKAVLIAWLLLPAGAAAYHYGPGQEALRLDDAGEAIERGREAAAKARDVAAKEGDAAARVHWAEADEAFGEALSLLPKERVAEARSVLLERAKAQMQTSQLPEARVVLEGLVEELSAARPEPGEADAHAALLADARETLANAQYYTTWLMRLEGFAREEWLEEIEASRQNFTLLASQAAERGDAQGARRQQESVESAVRLARIDLKELQGIPLPST